jgi:hypothetical protein
MANETSLSAASQGLGDVNINLFIKNNRNYIQGVGVMGQGGGTSINANVEYRWNFTNFVFNTTLPYTAILQYRGVGATTYNTIQVVVNGTDVEAVASALNTTLISQFNTYTDAGQTYLSTYNNKTEFNTLYLVNQVPDNIADYMVTEDGLFMVTESGELLITQDVSTNEFLVEVVVYPTDDPAVLVYIQEGGGGGTGGVTYGQVVSSYGQNNYDVKGLYIYSPNQQQLNKPISYSSYDAQGNAQVIAIPNVLNPNQIVPSSLVDLSQFDGSIVLDGQSQINTQVLPFNSLQIKFLSKEIASSADLSNNFLDMEEITGTKFFEPQGGDISEFERKDAEIINAIPEEVTNRTQLQKFKTNIRDNNESQNNGDLELDIFKDIFKSKGKENKLKSEPLTNVLSSDYVPVLLIGLITFATFMAIYNKDKG